MSRGLGPREAWKRTLFSHGEGPGPSRPEGEGRGRPDPRAILAQTGVCTPVLPGRVTPPPLPPPPAENSHHLKVFLPKKLVECVPKCPALPKERLRWNTNEVGAPGRGAQAAAAAEPQIHPGLWVLWGGLGKAAPSNRQAQVPKGPSGWGLCPPLGTPTGGAAWPPIIRAPVS